MGATTKEGRVLSEPLGRLGTRRVITVTAASSSATLTAGVQRISVVALGCQQRIRIGTGAQTALTTDHVILANERLDLAVRSGQVVAAIRDAAATSDGTLEISELV